jgi:hypothetical protein
MLISAVLLLVGCACRPSSEPLRDVVLVPEKKTVSIPAETLRDCDPIPKLEDRPYQQGEMPAAINKIVTAASDCRKRKRDATKSLKDALNISK